MELFKNQDDYYAFLDSVLPDKYIKERRLTDDKKHLYYPTAIQESIADAIFIFWNVADEHYSVIANEIICTVKLVYQPNYPVSEERFCTGSASTPIQMTSKSNVSDFPKNKISNALSYNLPSVRSSAIGNALETLGNIFGRNLSRNLSSTETLPSNFSLRELIKKGREVGKDKGGKNE